MAKSKLKFFAAWSAVFVVTAALLWSLPASAADLGGNCCADLEERIAELEATTARKGNRKVTLTVSGQISKAVLWSDFGDDSGDWNVGDNSNAPSYVMFAGEAMINSKWKAGYVLQVGLGDFQSNAVPGGYGFLGGDTNEIYVRKSYLWLSTEVGSFSLGKISQATDGVSLADVSNSSVASTPLSLRPLIGDNADFLDLGDGSRVNGMKYNSPIWYGFEVSASLAQADVDSSGDTDGSIWDVALRWAGELGPHFKGAAAVGYRNGLAVQEFDLGGLVNIGPLNIADVRVMSGSASAMHIPSGIFVNVSAFDMDAGDYAAALDNITGWAVKAGIEQKLWEAGDTTFYVERGSLDFGDLSDDKLTYWGAGLVQSIDAAAMDLFISGRKYEMDNVFDSDPTMYLAGARIKF